MSQQVQGNTKTFVASGTIGAFTRIKLSGANIVVCAANDSSIGVAQVAGVSGDVIPVKLLRKGTFKCQAAGAITAGAAIFSGANGQVAASGTGAKGWALEAATAANDVIECIFND
jgi:hypothetical protein